MKENNYSVYAHITPDGMVYIGVTDNIKRRWHSRRYGKDNSLYQYIVDYGWNSIEHIVLYSRLTRDEAFVLEGKLIDFCTLNDCRINKMGSGLFRRDDPKGYRKHLYETNDDYRNRVKDKSVRYNKEKRDKRLEYWRAYNELNRERKLEQDRKYRKEHREECLKRDRKRYAEIHSEPWYLIYTRVRNYNRTHEAIETPLEAKMRYLEHHIIPKYIKQDGLA